MNKTINTKVFHREAKVQQIQEEERSIHLAFSSEEPVERSFGMEVLDHDPSSVRLGRLESSGSLLVNHNPDDLVGKVESVSLGSDRVARAVVRFGKSDRASEIFQDVKDGIRSGVSVGYQIHKMKEERSSSDSKEPSSFRAVDWEPVEVSLVSIPADPSVGVGRSEEGKDIIRTNIEYLERKVEKMTEESKTPAPEPEKKETVDVEAVRSETRANEVKRIQEISALGDQFEMSDLARQHIDTGKSIEEMRQAVLEKMPAPKPVSHERAPDDIDFSKKEEEQYSFVKALNAQISGDWSKAGLEREVSDTIGKELNRPARGMYIPDNFWSVRASSTSVNIASTVPDLRPMSQFIEYLKATMVLGRAGARFVSGINGNLNIPRQNVTGAVSWLADNEGNAFTERTYTTDSIALTPHQVGVLASLTRKALTLNGAFVEEMIKQDMAQNIARAVDKAGLVGSGSTGEPQGVIGTTGINAITEAGGNAGQLPTPALITQMISKNETENALTSNSAFITTPYGRATLASTMQASGTAIPFLSQDGRETMYGYNCYFTSSIPIKDQKPTASAQMVFGNWDDLIVAEWTGTDVIVDPYTLSSSGKVQITVMKDFDIGVRHAKSFCLMSDLGTASA